MEGNHAALMGIARWGERLRYACAFGLFVCAVILGILVAGGFNTPEESFAAALYTLVCACGGSTNVKDLSFNSTRIIADEAMQALIGVLPGLKVVENDSGRTSLVELCCVISVFFFTLPFFYVICDRRPGPYEKRRIRCLMGGILGLLAGALIFTPAWSVLLYAGGIADPYASLIKDQIAYPLFLCAFGASVGSFIGQAWPEDRGPMPARAFQDETLRFAGIWSWLLATGLMFLAMLGTGTSPGQRTAAAVVGLNSLIGSNGISGPLARNYTGKFLDVEGFNIIKNDVLPYLPNYYNAMRSMTQFALFAIIFLIVIFGAAFFMSSGRANGGASRASTQAVPSAYRPRKRCFVCGLLSGLATGWILSMTTRTFSAPVIVFLILAFPTFCALIGTACPERRGSDLRRRSTDVEAPPAAPAAPPAGGTRGARHEGVELRDIQPPTAASTTSPPSPKTPIDSTPSEATTAIATPASSISDSPPHPETATNGESSSSHQTQHIVNRERAHTLSPSSSSLQTPTTSSFPMPHTTTHAYHTDVPGQSITTSWIEDVALSEEDIGARWVAGDRDESEDEDRGRWVHLGGDEKEDKKEDEREEGDDNEDEGPFYTPEAEVEEDRASEL